MAKKRKIKEENKGAGDEKRGNDAGMSNTGEKADASPVVGAEVDDEVVEVVG